ncbi:chemotaxis protein MotB [Limimonas halophila]|uniref:Chemotaxis protein MotB n=1 Tax=Limimonas halophila TaxID=1082479 RepID=A0A1G7SA36_9PROT|nr:OmpA family protein [Limimonas halophila]SDG19319.1 chemotaxis protein MotB [Limimonas halophila]
MPDEPEQQQPRPTGRRREPFQRGADDGTPDPPSAAAGGSWLMPFTDIVTLLLIFFVIFTTILDPPEDTTGTGQGLLSGGRIAAPDDGSGSERAAARVWDQRVDRLTRRARGYLTDRGLSGRVELRRTEAGVRLRVADRLLFPSGEAGLRGDGRALLDRLAPLLKDLHGRIRVEGHTDDVPIETARYPSNWELSAARAIAVVKALKRAGVAGDRLAAVGYGPERPIGDNATAAGRARNRRVAIFLTPPVPGRKAPVWPPSLTQ